VMSGLIHTGLGSSSIIAHVVHSPPPPPANSFVIGPAVINTHTYWHGSDLKKWRSVRKTAPHGAPRRDIRSPWRQLLSLPIPCHVHWPRSYCQSPAHPPAICGKPCFRGPSGCMRGAGTFGPLLRAGCAGAAWVRHGNLGSGMRAGRRCLAPRVGSVRWAGSLRATRARALVALAGA
jgi:hypothetical protein